METLDRTQTRHDHNIWRSIEGASSVTVFFVEPNAAGAWRIAAQSKYEVRRFPGDPIQEKSSTYEAYFVKRVKPGTEELALRPEISEGARVPARSYRLKLMDRQGNIITEL
jgi:hypothetical protein